MRLIDADKLGLTDFEIILCNGDYKEVLKQILCKIELAPTIDAESVICCKDCNFCGEIDENGWHCCENLGVGMPKNGFCSDAERKEVE